MREYSAVLLEGVLVAMAADVHHRHHHVPLVGL